MKIHTNYLALLSLLFALAIPGHACANSLPDYSSIIEEVLPSVVTITTSNSDNSTSSTESNAAAKELPTSNSLEAEFISQILTSSTGNSGSGFIFSAEGYVLTNAHVINNAERITVKLHDGETYSAQIIGQDDVSDIALLKISANELKAVALAGPDQPLKVGQTVLGIGSPYSFDYSVTSGIISYLGRNLSGNRDSNQYASYIQTDMLINPGNSGGPIINGNGDVIGMSSRIFSNTGSSIGISFGIPVNIIDSIVDKFLNESKANQNTFGLQTANVNPNQIQNLGLQQAIGAQVLNIDLDSYADRSGIEVNDVIVTIDGNIIRNNEEFLYQLNLLSDEHPVKVTAVRNGHYFATELFSVL
jgi:serine protease Do